MNELCFMSNLTSGEWTSWVQAVSSGIAIVAAGGAVVYQAGRIRLDGCERKASASSGIARMLVHFSDHGIMVRW